MAHPSRKGRGDGIHPLDPVDYYNLNTTSQNKKMRPATIAITVMVGSFFVKVPSPKPERRAAYSARPAWIMSPVLLPGPRSGSPFSPKRYTISCDREMGNGSQGDNGLKKSQGMEENGWKETACIASIRNSEERTSSVRVSHSSKESADVSPHNTRSVDLRGEITCFPRLKALIGVVNGKKRRGRRRKIWEQTDPLWGFRNQILQSLAIFPINLQMEIVPLC